jgi:hypothetical protein
MTIATIRGTGKAFFVAACLFAPGLASSHDFWINHGNYKSPIDGVHCCGDNDCKELPDQNVRIGPNGYSLLLSDPAGRNKSVVELVPFFEAQPSEDGHYWRCKRYDGSRRCFFAPMPSS